MKATTITAAADIIREKLDQIANNNAATYYFTLELDPEDDDRCWKIRVADHSARSANVCTDNFLSFVMNWNRQDCNVSNEFCVDENGDFEEEYMSIEECIDFHVN